MLYHFVYNQVIFPLLSTGMTGRALWANTLRNFVDGLVLGAAFTTGVGSGLSTSVAVLSYELPHGIGKSTKFLLINISNSSEHASYKSLRNLIKIIQLSHVLIKFILHLLFLFIHVTSLILEKVFTDVFIIQL